MDRKNGENEKINVGSRISAGETSNTDLKENADGFGSSQAGVDQNSNGGMRICEPVDEEGTSGNSDYLVDEVVLERMIVMNSGEIASISGENKNLGVQINELRLTGMVSDPRTCLVENVGQQIRQDFRNSANDDVVETVILITSEVNPSINNGCEQLEIIKARELEPSKVMADKSKLKVPKGGKQSCCSFDDSDGETVCRICHLSSDGMTEIATTASSMELIQLGCGCKNELGAAHAYCAESWFKVKGNRICEICGETAKNITGLGDNRFLEEWNQRRLFSVDEGSSESRGGCWRGQPFCNFLMACLVIAFVLPWFFRVNMF